MFKKEWTLGSRKTESNIETGNRNLAILSPLRYITQLRLHAFKLSSIAEVRFTEVFNVQL